MKWEIASSRRQDPNQNLVEEEDVCRFPKFENPINDDNRRIILTPEARSIIFPSPYLVAQGIDSASAHKVTDSDLTYRA